MQIQTLLMRLALRCGVRIVLLIACGLVPTVVLPQSTRQANLPTVKEVRAQVQQAVNYRALRQLRQGFVIEEFVKDEKDSATSDTNGRRLSFGAAGEFREDSLPTSPRPFGFDGHFAWQPDRSGFPTPVPQRLREKLLLPAWFRSYWWLNERAPLVWQIVPAATDEKYITLALQLENGLVGAQVTIDRTTWLPQKLVVEYERGPYTVTVRDYQARLGILFPQRVVINYRNADTEFQVASITELLPSARSLFQAPPAPADTTFDNSQPAALAVAQGVPFAGGADGHFYVRPRVNGQDFGWFHFDTGGDALHIDTKLADELKMPILGKSQTMGADGRPREVTIRQGQTFQLGRMIYRNPIFLAMDLSDRNAPPGEKRAGLVGYPVLARAVLEVTGGGQQIALYDPTTYRLARGHWQELFYIDLTPAAWCRLEGNRTGLFQLDTGHTDTVTFYDKYIMAQDLLAGRTVTEETTTGAGGSYQELRGRIEWFELAGQRFRAPQVSFRVKGFSREGGAGVIGRKFLAPFTIVFDYPARRIAFLRTRPS